MSRNDDFTRTLETWLGDEAPSQAPDRVLTAALERAANVSQRRSWLQRLRGETATASGLRVAALAAVVAIAVFAGMQFSKLLPDVGDASPTPTTAPSADQTPKSSLSPSVVPLPSLSPAMGCLDSPPDVALLAAQTDPVPCFGNAPLTFDADLTHPGVVDCPGVFEPAWLYCAADGWLSLVGETRKVGAPFLIVAFDPTGDLSVSAPKQTVRVTGHFDDPVAQTCREIQPPLESSPRPEAEVIEGCRATFVVTQIVALGVSVPTVLAPNAFARVVAGSVNVRLEAGLDAPLVGIPIADGDPLPAQVGTQAESEHVYILEGPVHADGFEWFRVAPVDYEAYERIGPYFIGWMASGDGVDPWLVVENPCPGVQLSLIDVTYTATTTDWATRLGCFRGQELTFEGWYPELPADFETPGPCPTEPAFFYCHYQAHDIRPIEMAFYDERNANRLEFVVNPESGIVVPDRGQWIEITGHWDDPASALCPTEGDIGTLYCRIQFVVTSVRGLGAR